MKDLVLEHIGLVDLLAAKRFPGSSLADEATLFVLKKLEENDWQRVRTFSGRARFSTFLSVLTKRLLEDFARKKYGRVRPPVWLNRIGGFWLKVFQYLCLERLSFPETVETLAAAVPARSRAEIEQAATTILEKIQDCGSYRGPEQYAEDDVLEQAANNCTEKVSIEDKLLDKDRAKILQYVFRTVFAEPQGSVAAEDIQHSFDQFRIELDPEERLLLKLRFVEGMSVTAAGKMLGLPDHQARKKLRDVLDRLHDTFEKAGVDERIRNFLNS